MVSASRRDVLRYGLSAVLAPGIVAAASGVPPAGAAPTRLIDFAERLVSPEQIKAAGFDGALVYVECPARDPLPPLPDGWQWLRSKAAGEVGYHLAQSGSPVRPAGEQQ